MKKIIVALVLLFFCYGGISSILPPETISDVSGTYNFKAKTTIVKCTNGFSAINSNPISYKVKISHSRDTLTVIEDGPSHDGSLYDESLMGIIDENNSFTMYASALMVIDGDTVIINRKMTGTFTASKWSGEYIYSSLSGSDICIFASSFHGGKI